MSWSSVQGRKVGNLVGESQELTPEAERELDY